MNKKINLFVNGRYVCSSLRYKRCKDFVAKIRKDGKIEFAGLESLKIGKMDCLKVGKTDKVVARFEK